MAWNKPFDDKEIAYVEKHYPRFSCAEIARKLGRSQRGVEKLVKRIGLDERRACACAREEPGGEGPVQGGQECPEDGSMQDELGEMRELKKILKHALHEGVDPRSMPKLSAEYREVLKRISELEGEGEGDGGNVGAPGVELGSLLVSVPLRPA